MRVRILTGIDIVDAGRIEKAVNRQGERFLRRVFTQGEIAYCAARPRPYGSYAARFAAKEAAMKALGGGIYDMGFTEIEVALAGSGKPSIVFHGRAKERADALGVLNADLSLSHEKTMAVAVVVALAEGGRGEA